MLKLIEAIVGNPFVFILVLIFFLGQAMFAKIKETDHIYTRKTSTILSKIRNDLIYRCQMILIDKCEMTEHILKWFNDGLPNE